MQHRSQLQAIRDVASLINASSDLDAIFHQLVYAACHYGAWTMGGMMAIDQQEGFAHVIARHDPNLLKQTLEDRWRLSASPSLIALTRNEPVIIRDAQVAEAFPGYQQEALQLGYKTVVILPIGRTDLRGRALVLSLQSRSIVEVTEDDLAMLDAIIHLGAIAIDKARRLGTERAATERLQTTLDAHSGLMKQVLGDGSVESASAMIGRLLGAPTAVIDLSANLLVPGRSPRPDGLEDPAWRAAVQGDFARILLREARAIADGGRAETRSLLLSHKGANLALPARIEPLFVDREPVGALVVFAETDGFAAIDPLLLESAKFALSVQLMRSHIRFSSESRSVSELFIDIVEHRWRDPADLATRARRLGVDLAIPAQLLAIGFPDQDGTGDNQASELNRAVARLTRRRRADAMTALVGDVTLCRIPADALRTPSALKALIREITEEARFVGGLAPAMALSKVCEQLADHPPAWEECQRLLRLAKRFQRRGLVTAQDFGPFPALLSSSDTREVKAFIEHSIGALLRHDQEQGGGYVETLSRYLSLGCRPQACADALGLHVTTLRYRLARLRELFGVDLDSPDRRFAVELALRLHQALSEQTQEG
ncbi:MAG: helix-turn-helix domain-containing protein [Elsteraceae bacterium]